MSKTRSLAIVTRLRHRHRSGCGLTGVGPDWWWVSIGAVAILAMFLGASIPMMETRSLERRPEYQDVIDRVSRFVPRPPKTPHEAVS